MKEKSQNEKAKLKIKSQTWSSWQKVTTNNAFQNWRLPWTLHKFQMKLRQPNVQQWKKKNPQKLDSFFLQPPSRPNKQFSKALKLKKWKIWSTPKKQKENTIVKSCNDKMKVYLKSTKFERKWFKIHTIPS